MSLNQAIAKSFVPALRTVSSTQASQALLCPLCLNRAQKIRPRPRRFFQRTFVSATEHRPQTLEQPPASAPRNADVPNTSVANGNAQFSQPPHLPVQSSYTTTQPNKNESELEAQHPKQTGTAGPAVGSVASPDPAPSSNKSRRRTLRPRKAAMTLSPAAVEQLRELLNQPEPKLIRVGVKNRGCSGLAYHLEYVEKPGTFDEAVDQDGVKVLVDSKALFSIIGSEMDWIEDKLSRRFVFKNPNITEQCGCGESFSIS